MKNSILVASPDTHFCEQIRSNLEEGGRFSVQIAGSAHETIRFANRKYFDLAILDAELRDLSLVQLTHELLELQPALKLLLYPPENNPQHPSILGIAVNGYLKKPFFAPELSHFLKDLLRPEFGLQSLISEPETEPANVWLQNPDQIKILLEHLLSQTSAYSGLVCIKGQAILEVGKISPQITQNVTTFLNHYWANYENQEIFRYMRMDADTSVILIYSLPINGGASITLLYPPAIQIKQVRLEAHRLRDAYLKQRMNMVEFAAPVEPVLNAEQRIERAETAPEVLEGELDEDESLSLADILGENELRNFNQILADMPSPDPLPAPLAAGTNNWIPTEELPEPAAAPIEQEPMLFAPSIKEMQEMNPSQAEEPSPQPEEAAEIISPIPQVNEMVQDAKPVAPSPVEAEEPAEMERVAVQDNVSEQSAEPEKESAVPVVDTTGKPIKAEETLSGNVDSSITEQTAEKFVESTSREMPSVSPDAAEIPNLKQEEQPAAESLSKEPLPAEQNLESQISTEAEPGVTSEESLEPQPPEAEPTIQELIESAVAFPWDETENAETGGVADEEPETGLGSEATPVETNTLAEEQPQPSFTIEDFRFCYSCLLVPCDEKTFLIRDLAEQLAEWLPQIHQERGWKLTSLTIRPQYLQWMILLPTGKSPREVIDAVKNETEAKIQAKYPWLTENGCFWASGYLALSGESVLSRSLILDFQAFARKNNEPEAIK